MDCDNSTIDKTNCGSGDTMDEKETDPKIISEEKCVSDVNSEDLNSEKHSQFYEISDSKVDYAVKIDDNDTLSDIDDIKTDTASADSEDSALGSLPPDVTQIDREEDAQDRSDGSDSGLGSETIHYSKLPCFELALPSSNAVTEKDSECPQENKEHEILKTEKPEEVKSDIPLKSSLKRKLHDENNLEPLHKKRKETIKFEKVTVFYFPRAQGFSCVPSQGGSTLGMEWKHTHIQNFTLAEHAMEQRRLHRQLFQQLKSERHSMSGVSLSSSEDSDTEEEASDISESELDLDSYYFLQPVPTRQRRALLRAAGVRKIEGYEKDECRDIRTSREFCGCACKGVCNPDNCSCSLAGIKCQVDRLNFPCGCSRDGCGNTTGRIEFNPIRVRTHFINTLVRLGLEKKNEESQEAKRQWAAARAMGESSQCISHTSYEKDNCHIAPNPSIHRTPLSSQPETCVTPGTFTNFHKDINIVNTTRTPEDNTNKNSNENMHILGFDENSDHRNQAPYTSDILQGKGPPYSVPNAMAFNIPNNLQRYSCDLNYTYDQRNHAVKSLQSYSATSFEDFAQSSHISMFNPYGHIYTTEYMHKPAASMADQGLQYHEFTQNHYEMYKNTCGNSEAKFDSNYTALMPYQSSNKLQSVDNDENWFSQNTLLNLDSTEQSTQDASDTSQPTQSSSGDPNEVTENFGELIKKTMVESVIV